MKYAVWFVRLIFAAWMIPAGINHFIRIFPQPMGSQPLSMELISALIDSNLFTLVKAVELLAGIAVLTGFYLPLALVVAMPVSFCVWYWDTPLEGWGSSASIFGSAVLLCNVLLCLAYLPKHYREMFALRSKPKAPGGKNLVLAGQVIFGAWMLVSGINHFFGPFYAEPTGTEPLAVQLMSALVHSQLIDVAIAIQLVAGALILTGFFTPVALCVVMPVTVCAAYWAVILEHSFLGAILALVAVGLNGLLMLAHIDYYKGVLQRRGLAIGEPAGDNMTFDSLYALPGSTPRGPYIGALITLLVAFSFYHFVVPGLTSLWCQLMLVIPATVLHARRLQEMGQMVWLAVIPAALLVATFWLKLASPGTTAETAVGWAAIVVSAGFILWSLVGKNQAAASQMGKPAT